ncbi:MAG: hypothetical protein [Inoviridae sp.]|nr:MAG: hypothetical protein [Inoviridae sp.]
MSYDIGMPKAVNWRAKRLMLIDGKHFSMSLWSHVQSSPFNLLQFLRRRLLVPRRCCCRHCRRFRLLGYTVGSRQLRKHTSSR